MNCQIIRVNSKKPEQNIIQKTARIIKKGGLVAFPTETVYGLGANALNKKAVKKIFKVKGRPLDNPVIVHIANVKDLSKIAKNIPKTAEILVRKFWPGPLTLVLFKKKIIPAEVTASANTVAIRMPKNKIALNLIKTATVPIAAPSANLAGKPSPTTAQHVFDDLRDKIDLILDGGPTKIGVESTVVDLTVNPPQILRPGGVNFEELKKVIKDIQFHPSLLGKKFKGRVKSPGMKYRHYAPKAPLILIEEVDTFSPPFARRASEGSEGEEEDEILFARLRLTRLIEGNLKERVKKFKNLINFYKKQKKRVGVMISQETKRFLKEGDVTLVVGNRKNLKEVSRNLFKILRKFDKMKVDVILAETFSEKGIGFAIMHRLKKAAQKVEK